MFYPSLHFLSSSEKYPWTGNGEKKELLEQHNANESSFDVAAPHCPNSAQLKLARKTLCASFIKRCEVNTALACYQGQMMLTALDCPQNTLRLISDFWRSARGWFCFIVCFCINSSVLSLQDCSRRCWTWRPWRTYRPTLPVVHWAQRCSVSWWNMCQASQLETLSVGSATRGVRIHLVRTHTHTPVL